MSDRSPNTATSHGGHQTAAPVARTDATTASSIDVASRKAFGSTALYLQSELEATGSDLQLLEKLNDASISKYEGLSRQAQDMLVHAYKVKQTYNEMESQMAEVDSLVESINSLEKVAAELDRYSLQLEAKFQKLLK
ncbi:RalA-binding protein 1 [Coemansia sp. RSA 2671]|uniref:RalA-binding protein 1 n=1 Tax=Coemansia linderi TaxID=2663919 RepID=A0ACC1KC34_9FUNG|nr:RalA-binding protein 1 [Coemansia sp. RSA 2675]KAJ2011614.1 RalA-binding protein 1 [Coemansia sp. S610]KAJ2337332.1 RalA-binding protein 1 [Coemansia sp. RSA 2671]KAJ2784194.1 RalA-binding protein 1 [Coemansia linderi]